MAAVCEFVLYHHSEDAQDWPALVLHVEEDGEHLLQVFRPRANYWARAYEGLRPGCFTLQPDPLSHPDAITLDEAIAKVNAP